jgi:hypothetical protein
MSIVGYTRKRKELQASRMEKVIEETPSGIYLTGFKRKGRSKKTGGFKLKKSVCLKVKERPKPEVQEEKEEGAINE